MVRILARSVVSSNDQTLYLPESADASRVQQLIGEFSDSDAIPAVIVFAGEEPLSGEKIKQLNDAFSLLLGIDGVSPQVSPLIPSEDGKALEAFVPIDTSADIGAVVEEISGTLDDAVPEGVQSFVTGPAGFTADLGEAFSGIDGLLLMVALAAVFVILIIVYRSFLLPIAVLSTSLFALTVALLTV